MVVFPQHGGCLCGDTRYTLNESPLTVYACHCTDCQRQTGASFSLSMVVRREAVQLLRGHLQEYSIELADGRRKGSNFCGRCSTRLWGPSRRSGLAILEAGTLDDTSWFRPVAHIWTRSAQPWVRIPEDTLNFDHRPQGEALFRAWKESTMSVPSEAELPNVALIVGAVLQRIPEAQRPLLIALAERLAAERYRRWAEEVADRGQRPGLLACAAREEEIARRVEALYPNAASVQQELLSANPDLEEINRSIFADRPLDQQFTIQVQGERLGAATWRALAQAAESEAVRETFLGCAPLEEESASYLESLLARRVPSRPA